MAIYRRAREDLDTAAECHWHAEHDDPHSPEAVAWSYLIAEREALTRAAITGMAQKRK